MINEFVTLGCGATFLEKHTRPIQSLITVQ
jgi:hypothetical protein